MLDGLRRSLASRLLVIGLDLLSAGLAATAAAVAHTGGLTVHIAGARVSLSTPMRTLLALAVALAIRRAVSRSGPLGRSRAEWRRVLNATGGDEFPARAPAGFWRRAALASVGFAVALAVLLHDQVLHMYSVPDLGDPLFSMWRIGWITHQLSLDSSRLFDGNIFYPEHATLTLSDPMILPALMAAPLLALGLQPVLVYNLLLLSAFWLSGIATYLLVERLSGSPRAAFVAGLMYACYSHRFDHYSHLELQMTWWMPLGLLALHLFMSTGRWRHAVALGLAGVAQLYSSMYYAVFFLVYATAIGVGLYLVHRPSARRLLLPAVLAAALAATLAMPLARVFVDAQGAKGERPLGEIRTYSATPIDYLRAPKSSVLWRSRMLPPVPERTLFPGLAPTTLGVMGLTPPLGAMQLAYAAGLLLSFDGSLGLNGITYPYLHRWLAPVRGLRSPARFAAIVGLALSILAGFGARRVLGWCHSPSHRRVVFAGLVASVLIDAWPALALQPVWLEPPPIYRGLKGVPGVVLAEFPILPDETGNIPFMYFSLWHWTPMVNGYSGFIPASYAELRTSIAAFPDAASVAALRARGVTHVSINCGLLYPGCTELLREMWTSPSLRLIADTQWNGQPVQLYEVARP